SWLAGSIPPVSIKAKLVPFHSASAYILSLVTPGVSSTIEMRRPTILLKKVDLPTLGLPTMATIGLLIEYSSYEFFRNKFFQIFYFFPDAYKLNRHVKLICHRNCYTAFSSAIQFCYNDTGYISHASEFLSL